MKEKPFIDFDLNELKNKSDSEVVSEVEFLDVNCFLFSGVRKTHAL